MAKGTRRGPAARRRRSYIGTLALVALLMVTYVSACLALVLRGSLISALGRILADPSRAAQADLELVGIALGADLAAACTVVAGTALAIRALRILVYTRQMHWHAEAYLARHAPLHRAGIAPDIVPFDPAGLPAPDGAGPLRRFAARSRHLLLLGAAGSGKTVALHALAADLTRKRVTIRAGRRTPLPVLVALADFARAQATSSATLVEHVADRVERFGSPGLAARVPRLLRRGQLVLLCDELDAVPPDRRSVVCAELTGIARAHPRVTVIVGCGLETYEAHAGIRTALRPFDRVVVSGLTTEQVRVALRHTRVSGATTRPRRGDGRSPLAQHALDVSATQPAQLAALHALATSGDLPNGRGELWRRYLDRVLQPPRGDGADTSAPEDVQGDAVSVLAAFAATLRTTGKRYAEMLEGERVEEAISATIADPTPLPAPGGRRPEPPVLPEERMRTICETSLKAGILVTSEDGAGVGFSNGLVEAACAAQWLALTDDGFGALPPELLRPEWHLPLVLWSGADSQASADLAKRVLRLADTPDAVALRAGLPSPDDAVPMTLATALAVVAEGSVALLARASAATSEGDRARGATVQLVNDHLRDVLDLAQIYIAQPESAERLAERLRAVDRNADAECAANLVRLATAGEVTRLVRSQVITLLGLLATPPALEGLTDLLGEMDAVIRQGVNQAFVSAGAAALPYLERASRHGNAKARGRAAEVLAMIGGGAATSAVALLASEDAHQRALAAATLGTLRAQSAERALIERLDDAAPDVRAAAARALGRLATPAGLEAVADRAKADDPQMRAAVAEALGLAQEPRYVPVVLSLLTDPAATVRAAAATSLGLLGDERAVTPLEGAREDGDAWVRNAAEIALRRLGRMA